MTKALPNYNSNSNINYKYQNEFINTIPILIFFQISKRFPNYNFNSTLNFYNQKFQYQISKWDYLITYPIPNIKTNTKFQFKFQLITQIITKDRQFYIYGFQAHKNVENPTTFLNQITESIIIQ